MSKLTRAQTMRLALTSLAISAAITAVGFYQFIVSIHDPSTTALVIQRIAMPFFIFIGQATSDAAGYAYFLLGAIVWAAAVFTVLAIRARAKAVNGAA